MRPFLVGLAGKKKSGKDTSFGIIKTIANTSGFTISRVAFADALKAEVAEMCGIGVEEIEKRKDYFRPLLQWWGQYRRDVNPDYWIRMADAVIDDSDSEIVVITDVRYLNELRYIHGWDGVCAMIRRDVSGSLDPHPSETEVDKFKGVDCTIFNTSIEALVSQVNSFWDICVMSAYYGRGSKAGLRQPE